MQGQKRELEDEIASLRERVSRGEEARQSQDHEKAKFMEGAVWLGKKVTNEVERLCQTMDSLVNEYQ